jgi:ribosomal protein S18 acetylase RimI-like enzyme
MTVSYRGARIEDAQAVADVFRTSFVDTFGHLYPDNDLQDFLKTKTAEQFRAEIENPRYLFRLAEEAGTLAGYVKLGPPELPIEAPQHTIELCQLYLLTAWHGSGIAGALMDWTLGEAATQGAEHIQLSVYVDNVRARRFYERYGFHAVGRYDFMVGSHADEDIILRHVVMQADQ